MKNNDSNEAIRVEKNTNNTPAILSYSRRQKNEFEDNKEDDLKLIRKMKKYADDGYDVELRKSSAGGYKVLKVKKELITAD